MSYERVMDFSPLLKGLESYKNASKQAIQIAMDRCASQFLMYCNDGSENEPTRPPIKWGVLRASSSVFSGSKLIGIWSEVSVKGGGDASPLTSFSAPDSDITIVYNVDYAAKMHEWPYPFPSADKDPQVGNQWITKHLQADGELLMKLFAQEVKRETSA